MGISPHIGPRRISIVVPVYNAPEALARCLAALRDTLPEDAPVILIDDASDDPNVPQLLETCSEKWSPATWKIRRHRTNRGFVATANHGMRLAASDDVVLLNADTIPAGRWLERIRACAASDSKIASITPFTNNGEIASIPEFCRNNPLPNDPEAWSQACLEAGPSCYPELPTAVGFCMYLRRAAIDAFGNFDEQAFGRGYGEENDWSMRAIAAGWRNVLCDDAYVAHQGGQSFGPLGLKPGPDAMERLLEKHPDYLEQVMAFIESDPLAERRKAIIAAYAVISGQWPVVGGQ